MDNWFFKSNYSTMMPPRLPVRPAAKTKPSTTTSRISQDIAHIHQETEAPMPPHTTFHKRRRRRDPGQSPDPPSEWRSRSRRSWCSPGVCLALILLSTACSVLGASSESAATSTISSAEQTDLSVSEPDDSTGIQPSAGGCAPQHWWDSNRNRCIPCTRCQDEMIPLRPCQLHADTICGSIYDLKIDWVVLAKTEPNWKEVSHGRHLHFVSNIPTCHGRHVWIMAYSAFKRVLHSTPISLSLSLLHLAPKVLRV